MIRVSRPKSPPRVLAEKGASERDALCAAYDSDPSVFVAGTPKHTFKSNVYGAASVKKALLQAQHGKCFACESKVRHVASGDVEHYRPKACVKQDENSPLERPGYYWLAYEWSNLYFACERCNRHFKRNLFPLSDPTQRARTHLDDLRREDPLLLNPAEEDPEEHIEFDREFVRPVKGSSKGRTTIRVAGLDRPELEEHRRQRYNLLVTLRNVSRIAPDDPDRDAALRFLDSAIQDDADYASMARCLLRG